MNILHHTSLEDNGALLIVNDNDEDTPPSELQPRLQRHYSNDMVSVDMQAIRTNKAAKFEARTRNNNNIRSQVHMRSPKSRRILTTNKPSVRSSSTSQLRLPKIQTKTK